MTTDMTQEKKLHFNGSWRSYQKRILDQLELGGCEIVYTRNLNGRKLLLKARKYASSSMKRMFSKRLSKWQ